MATAQRLFMMGYDGMNYQLLRRFLREGCLPTMQSLLNRGSLNRLLCAIPAWTPTNWSTLVTGTTAGGHRTASWSVRESRDPTIDPIPCWNVDAYGGAETIWQVAEEAGLRSLVTHYPAGSFGAAESGCVIGAGLSGAPASYAGSECYVAAVAGSDSAGNGVTQVSLQAATACGWRNAGEGDLVATLTITGRDDCLYLLVRENSERCDDVSICTDTDASTVEAGLTLDDWSAPVFHRVGPDHKTATTRFRLMSAGDGEVVLYRSAVTLTSGHGRPEALADEIQQHCGPFFEPSHMIDEPDDDVLAAWLDQMRIQGEWEVSVARYVQAGHGWDLHFCHWHPFDWINHASINELDPDGPNYDRERAAWYLEAQRQTYQLGDDVLRQFLELEREGDLVSIIADHGMAPAHRTGFVPTRLQEVGLLASDPNGQVDMRRSKVYGSRAIWVNLEGREPGGIVASAEYERVQEEIIDALLDWRDPATGKRVVAFALKIQDAQIIGHWGYHCGDVAYAMNRGFGWSPPLGGGALGEARDGEHASQIPTSESPEATNLGCCLLAGPGIRVGYERDWERWGLMRMVDMAPTFASCLGLRAPRHSTGAVLGDLLE